MSDDPGPGDLVFAEVVPPGTMVQISVGGKVFELWTGPHAVPITIRKKSAATIGDSN